MLEVVLAFIAGGGMCGFLCYRLGLQEGKQVSPVVTQVVPRNRVDKMRLQGWKVTPDAPKQESKPVQRPAWSGWRARAEGKSLSEEQKREQRENRFKQEQASA